jgi:hypothetical protein
MALAEKYGIKKYPTPAGGCALTQKGFASRLRELMGHKPDFNPDDVDLVRFGRHFWVDDIQIILGRDKEENEFLKSQAKEGGVFIVPVNFNGPEALIKGEKISEEIMDRAKDLIVEFSSKAEKLKPEELVFDIIKK